MSASRSSETLAEYVERWKSAAPLLQEIRDADIRGADTAEAMRMFSGSATWAVLHRPVAAESGLVAQQFWFQKLRAR